jgi:hypothetical protein
MHKKDIPLFDRLATFDADEHLIQQGTLNIKTLLFLRAFKRI